MAQNENALGVAEQLDVTYNSMSGVNIHVALGNSEVGEVQGVSFTVTREKAPIYTMGRANPRSFSRGKRGIAGSMIAVVFDRSNIINHLKDQNRFWASKNEISRSKVVLGQQGKAPRDNEVQVDRVGVVALEEAWYHDQLPPFTINLVGFNEYGHGMRMEIRGAEILNSGSGISVDDITTDENFTYVATDVIPWSPLEWQGIQTAKIKTPFQADAFTNAT